MPGRLHGRRRHEATAAKFVVEEEPPEMAVSQGI
jgi:hypothetical protein